MGLTDYFSAVLLVFGILFFLAGTLGLLRFPDVYTRLHALTKADNVGLGLIAIGLSFQADSWTVVCRLLLIWILVLLAGASTAHLISQGALKRKVQAWKR